MGSATPNDATHRGHEPDVVNAHVLMISGTGLVLLVALTLLMIYGTTRFLTRQVESEALGVLEVHPTHTTTGPQVTSEQPRLLDELRETEQQRLTTYEWIDQRAGIARIPIDRAMDILAEQGLPMDERRSEEHDDNQAE